MQFGCFTHFFIPFAVALDLAIGDGRALSASVLNSMRAPRYFWCYTGKGDLTSSFANSEGKGIRPISLPCSRPWLIVDDGSRASGTTTTVWRLATKTSTVSVCMSTCFGGQFFLIGNFYVNSGARK